MVSDWGGKMYLVYLPNFERYTIDNVHPDHDFVMQTATELGIPIIDIHSEVFDPHPDPLSLFPFSIRGHYNAEGYKLVAEAIGERLDLDGYVPIKSKK
jgi:Lysophospholipase L1 and related esterases